MDRQIITELKALLADLLEDESELKRKKNDLYAQGQLAAAQVYRVKLETILENNGVSRVSTIQN